MSRKLSVLNRQNTMKRAHTYQYNQSISSQQLIRKNIRLIQDFLKLQPKDRNFYLPKLVVLSQHLKFFRTLVDDHSQQAVTACWKFLKYHFVSASNYVFWQNQEGKKFYIILEGSVRILKREAGKQVELGVLKSGESFGQRALMLKVSRSASIQAISDCHLGFLDQEYYQKLLEKIDIQNFRILDDLLRNIPTLQDISKRKMNKICYYFKRRKLAKRQILYNSGDPIKKVYLILKGEIRLSKRVSVTVKNRQKNSLSRNKHFVQDFQMISLGPGELFGDQELWENLNNRIYTSVCFQQSTVFIIKKDQFIKHVLIGDQIEKVREKSQLKQALRQMLVNSSQKILLFKTGGKFSTQGEQKKPVKRPLAKRNLKSQQQLPVQKPVVIRTRYSYSSRYLEQKAGIGANKKPLEAYGSLTSLIRQHDPFRINSIIF